MIPMVDMARVFAKHGDDVDVTIIVTKANAAVINKNIDGDFNAGRHHNIRTHVLPFPSAEVGLPEGIESFSSENSDETNAAIHQAQLLLRKPMEQVFYDMRPDCIVADLFYPWTLEVANQLGIPRLAFRGGSYFSLCAEHSVRLHYNSSSSNSHDNDDVVSLLGLPHKIEMLTSQLPEWSKTTTSFTAIMDRLRETEEKSYGILMNSFHELESAYEEHYKTTMGLKAWSIGPVCFWANRDSSHKAHHRFKSVADGDDNDHHHHELMDWLNSKQKNSVVYVSFGSGTKLSAAQIKELAHGLETSGHPFIWVVRKEAEQALTPEGFEERIRTESNNRGLIIKGWAPQLLILDHPATGGMVTHCGWNSILEGVNAGLPMITWPVFAEQFYNEKLVKDVLRIGIGVGVKQWNDLGKVPKEVVKSEDISKAVRFLMATHDEYDGERAGNNNKEMRMRVSKLQNQAKMALEIGGSSHANLMALIHDLNSLKSMRN